jgi:multidrug efflux pump subunit AcrA (membrane-fusion protein)
MGKALIALAAVLAAIALFASSFGSPRARAEAALDDEDVALENKGYLVPVTQVQVSPRVSGEITEIHFEEGTRVKKGDLLARIEPTPYELDYKRAQALVDAARARLEDARAGDPGQVKKGPRNHHIDELRAELAAAEAECTKAKWLLDGTEIRAPISGTILTKKAEKGNTINPLSFNLKGSLCDMADLSKMEVDLTIQERDFAKIFKAQKCKISIEALPGVTYKGQVSRVMPIADRAKGAIFVRVRLEVPKDDGSLRPDMGVVVVFLGKSA